MNWMGYAMPGSSVEYLVNQLNDFCGVGQTIGITWRSPSDSLNPTPPSIYFQSPSQFILLNSHNIHSIQFEDFYPSISLSHPPQYRRIESSSTRVPTKRSRQCPQNDTQPQQTPLLPQPQPQHHRQQLPLQNYHQALQSWKITHPQPKSPSMSGTSTWHRRRSGHSF